MSRRLPSLNALRAFEAAARHESFSAAAAELHVTHAAVSRHIRDLERGLKVKLFVRTGRGVELSDAGRRYGERLTPLFDQLAEATRDIAGSAPVAELAMTVEPAFASRWLVPRLGRFAEANPGIELTVDPSDRLVNFRADPAELGVRFGHGTWPGVEVRLLAQVRYFPVASPELLKRRPVAAPDDLKDAPLLHEESRQWWEVWLRAAGAQGVDARRGPKFQTHIAIEAAEAGQGFALGDNVLCGDALLDGTLVKPFALALPEGGYYLVRPKGRKESTAARAFRDWITLEIAASEARLRSLAGPRIVDPI